jgi:hypothetical protein
LRGVRIAPVLAFVALTSVDFDAAAEPASAATDPLPPAARASAAEPPAVPAQVTPAPVTPPPVTPARRALNTTAAVVPGVLVHGSGHFVAGQPRTGYALLAAQGVGLGMMLAGGTTLVLSGASRYLVGPSTAATLVGFGLFGASFAADIYGSASADGGAAERTPRVNAAFESELGYRYVSDPLFSYDHLVVERLTLRTENLRLTPSAWFSTGGETVRYRIEGAVRLLGSRAGESGKTSDYIDLVLGGIHHRYIPERFQRTGAEAALDTRYDLAHLGPTLRGAFLELGVGYGLARITYDFPGRDPPGDADTILLGNFGFGAILRGKAAPGSEVKVYYDHRHDTFAAGLLMPGLVSGVLGRFGAEARWFFSERVGVLAEAQAGSALAGGLSLIMREGVFSRRERR